MRMGQGVRTGLVVNHTTNALAAHDAFLFISCPKIDILAPHEVIKKRLVD